MTADRVTALADATKVAAPAPATPWLAHYPPGVPRAVEPRGTLADMIAEACVLHAARPAFESFGARLTFGEVGARAAAVASWLRARGIAKGERVAVMMPNVMAYPVAMFGALLGGYAVVNVNPLYTPRELGHQLADSGARVLFVLENFAHVVEAARPELPGLEHVVVCALGDLLGLKGLLVNLVSRRVKKAVKPYDLPGHHALRDVLATPDDGASVAVAPDDVAFLQYTGGTTGVAKGAVLLHRNIVANVTQCEAWFGSALAPGIGERTMVTALPLYHIFALTCCCLLMLRFGAMGLLIANPRDIPGFVKTLRGARFTMISGVNTLYAALLDHRDIGKVDFSNVAFAVAGGMALQSETARRWAALTGGPITEGYGLTETSPVVTINPPGAAWCGTVGFPLPSTEVVVRDGDREVPVGERGELLVRGPQVMPGYWGRPDETAAAMTADGYFRTGDVAVLLPDGQVRIVDRLKDMVLVSGFNVYPNEVEDVLANHPMVKEVAVVGVPDAHSGEAVVAHVVARGPGLTEEALRAFAREGLTGYKVPKRVVFHDALPKTPVGKVLRRALRDAT